MHTGGESRKNACDVHQWLAGRDEEESQVHISIFRYRCSVCARTRLQLPIARTHAARDAPSRRHLFLSAHVHVSARRSVVQTN